MGVVAHRTDQGHTLLGGEEELRAHLTGLVAAGRLTADGLLDQGRLPNGQCFARVQLVDVEPRRRVRRPLLIASALTAAAVVGLAVWLVITIVAWVVAHIAVIVAVLVLAVLVLASLGSSGDGCTIIHRRG
jgi:predicted lysophospholipase L1 biosynthesis ABC-type transport system permease subunit